MKRICSMIMALIMLALAVVPVEAIAFAEEGILRGAVNDTVNYSFDISTGTLTFTGTGVVEPKSDIEENSSESVRVYAIEHLGYEWLKYDTYHLVISDGITDVNLYRSWFNKLESVYVGADFEGKMVYNDEGIAYKCFINSSDYLKKIDVSPYNRTYSSDQNGVLFSKDMKTLIKYPKGRNCDTYIVSNGVESIGEGAFGWEQSDVEFVEEGAKIRRLVFPKTVSRIGRNRISSLEEAYVLNPKCHIENFYGDGANHNFSVKCKLYMSGIKNETHALSGESYNTYHPLIYKNSRYFAFDSFSVDYSGKATKPKLRAVINSKSQIINPKKYKIKFSKRNKNVGKYSFTVNFKNGKKKNKFNYKIVPAPIKKVKFIKKKNKYILKWKKHSAQTTGFELRFNGKTTVIKNKNATSKTIKKNKKNSYGFIRAYKIVKGKKYYSKWVNTYGELYLRIE